MGCALVLLPLSMVIAASLVFPSNILQHDDDHFVGASSCTLILYIPCLSVILVVITIQRSSIIDWCCQREKLGSLWTPLMFHIGIGACWKSCCEQPAFFLTAAV